MKLLRITIGASATQVSATSIPITLAIVQNNNITNRVHVGDSSVTSSTGLVLEPAASAGAAGGSLTLGPFDKFNADLMNLYVAGTSTNVVDILYVQAD